MRWSQSIQPVRQKLAQWRRRRGRIGCGYGTEGESGCGAEAGGWRAEAASWRGCAGGHNADGGRCTERTAVTANATQGRRVSRLRLRQRLDSSDLQQVPCGDAGSTAVLRGKTMLNVRCPQCKTVIVLRPRAAAPAAGATAGSAPTAQAATPAAAETKPAAPPAADAGGGAAKSVAAPATAGGAAAKSFGVKAGAQKHGAASPAHTGSKK